MWEQRFLGPSRWPARSSAALATTWSVEGRPRLHDGRATADDLPHGMERGRDADAVSDAHRIPAPPVPRQRSRRGALPRRRRAGRAGRHPGAAVRRRHRDRPRGAMAVGVQVPPADVGRRHLPAHQRRPQRRDRVGAGVSASSLSRRQQAHRRSLPGSGRLARRGVAEGRVVVAGMGRVAGRALGRAGRRAGERGEGLPAAGDAPGTYVRQE